MLGKWKSFVTEVCAYCAVSSRADEESNAWNAKCEGLRQALQAQELHAENLEKELSMRPSSRQVICISKCRQAQSM